MPAQILLARAQQTPCTYAMIYSSIVCFLSAIADQHAGIIIGVGVLLITISVVKATFIALWNKLCECRERSSALTAQNESCKKGNEGNQKNRGRDQYQGFILGIILILLGSFSHNLHNSQPPAAQAAHYAVSSKVNEASVKEIVATSERYMDQRLTYIGFSLALVGAILTWVGFGVVQTWGISAIKEKIGEGIQEKIDETQKKFNTETDKMHARGRATIADIHSWRGDFDRAVSEYKKALYTFPAWAASGIGTIRLYQGKLSEATNKFKISMEKAEEITDDQDERNYRRYQAWDDYGIALMLATDFQSARSHYESVENQPWYKYSADEYPALLLHRCIARRFTSSDSDEKVGLLEEWFNGKRGILDAADKNWLVQLYLMNKEYIEAKDVLQKLKKNSDRIDNGNRVRDWLEYLIMIAMNENTSDDFTKTKLELQESIPPTLQHYEREEWPFLILGHYFDKKLSEQSSTQTRDSETDWTLLLTETKKMHERSMFHKLTFPPVPKKTDESERNT